jgi:uncharacterized protein
MTEEAKIVAAWRKAVETADYPALRALYAPDAQIWRLPDGPDFHGTGVEAHIDLIAWFQAGLAEVAVETAALAPTPTGFIWRQVFSGRTKAGAQFAIPIAIICEVSAGRITREWRYADTVQMLQLAQTISEHARGAIAPSQPGRAETAAEKPLALRWLEAVDRDDWDAVAACYHPDARVWRSIDALGYEGQTSAENIALTKWVKAGLVAYRLTLLDHVSTVDGFAMRLMLECEGRKGVKVNAPVATFCKLADGKIIQQHDYFDPDQLVRVFAITRTQASRRSTEGG